MSRFADYTESYRRDIAGRAASEGGGALAATGEHLALAMQRLGSATDCELPGAAAYVLEVARDHRRALAAEGLPDEAAATTIGVLVVLLHRRAVPSDFAGEFVEALADITVQSLSAARRAENEGDSFAAGHWTAIVMQQTALAAACLREFGDCGLAEAPRIRLMAETVTEVPRQWQGRPVSPYSSIDILTDSAGRLYAMGKL